MASSLRALNAFELGCEPSLIERYGSGHINDTYRVVTDVGRRFILQRINGNVFRDPAALMENVARVTSHLAAAGLGERERLSLVPTRSGEDYAVDDGDYWRLYPFIEDSLSFDRPDSPARARAAAAMFGRFQRLLADLPAPRLNETIPGFHDTPLRYSQFREACDADVVDRVAGSEAEIAQALAFEEAACVLAGLDLPERIVHNDTKLNNVLFDEASGDALCVIDLDTIMPGIAPHDFGDLVRTATVAGAEDGNGLDMNIDYFAAVAEGYLSEAGSFLTDDEVDCLPEAALVITVEIGLRFLADHLAGDVYFRVQRPGHNLDRCRAQFTLAASIERQLEPMRGIVARLRSG